MPKMCLNRQVDKNKKLVLLPGAVYNSGDKIKVKPEVNLSEVEFNIFKFNNRTRPKDKKKVLIIFSFYEFGTEILGILYCIPRLIHQNPGLYVIVAGWYGREYLYRHLADEYWELKEEHQFLRDSLDLATMHLSSLEL